ncbi:hypothetical protein, partial [Pseudomonas syringae]
RCCIGGLLFGRHTCTSSYMLCPNTKFLTVSNEPMTDVDPGLIATIITLSIVITMCITFYIAHAYTEKFERCLPSCVFVEHNKMAFSNAGLLGKLMRCSMIYFYLWVPGLGKKRGLADIAEIRRFPAKLKYLLTIPWTAQIILLIALVLFTQLIAS